MQTIHVSKSTNEENPGVTLVVDQPIPKFDGNGSAKLCETMAYFEAQANAIADALWRTLPGGTFYRLTIAMMEKETVAYHVSMASLGERAKSDAA